MSTTTMPVLSLAQLNYAETAQWKLIVKQAAANTRVSSPAFLVSDMAANQTVTVQIAIQERVSTLKGPQWWDVPQITNVPVVMPRGGGFSMTLPLKKGDGGLLVFCDTCFDNWWLNGQNTAPPAQNTGVVSGSQTQFELRRHHVHDCGFFPGMWSQQDLLPAYSPDSLQIRTDDGTTTVIDVSQDGVTITGPAVALTAATTDIDLTAQVNANITADTVTLTSPLSPAGSFVVGALFELPGVVVPTTGAATCFIPVTIGGVAYKLLLQAV